MRNLSVIFVRSLKNVRPRVEAISTFIFASRWTLLSDVVKSLISM